MKLYSPYQYSIFRIILGLYLTIHFLYLIPYAAEVWSSFGMLPDASSNLTYGIFPNVLYIITSASGVTIYVGILALLSIFFMLGYQRQLVSILLWYGWASLFDRNNLISNPGIPYVGWLLLVCAVIPKGEPLSFSSSKKSWEMPKVIFIGAWAIMAIGYTISGFDKLSSPSWNNGTAIFHLLENPLARNYWLRDFVVQLPVVLLKIMTWAILFIELAFLPFAIFKPTRKWIWLAMIIMHLGILFIVDFADLTLGMLMIHWFTFDSNWLKPKTKNSGILFYDGVCGMCNGLINFMLAEDKNQTLLFAPLQGKTAYKNVDSKYLVKLSTIVYQEKDKTYTETNAIIHALYAMGGIYKLAIVLKLIPKFIRDKVYLFISANRYNWFGKTETCQIPSLETRGRLLA